MKDTNNTTIERGNEMAFDKAKYDEEWKKANRERIVIRVPVGMKDELTDMATRQGKNLSKFIKDALYLYMDSIGETKIKLD